MDTSQYLVAAVYAGAMAVAWRKGKIAPAIAVVIWGAFFGMVASGGDLSLMIVIDGLTLAALIFDGSRMALGLAYAYIAAIVIEAGGKSAGLPFNTTSTIVDATIIWIAAVIGGTNGRGGRLDFALGTLRARVRGRGYSGGLSLVARYNAMFDLAGTGAGKEGLKDGQG